MTTDTLLHDTGVRDERPGTNVDPAALIQAVFAQSRQVQKLARRPRQEVLRRLHTGNARASSLAPRARELADAFSAIATALEDDEKSRVLADAKERGREIRETLVESGQLLTSGELTAALQITRQALAKAVASHRVFFIESAGRHFYPRFYAEPTLERRRVERVSQSLGDLPGWEKWLFFTTPKASLGSATPLDALQRGPLEPVLRAAAGYAER